MTGIEGEGLRHETIERRGWIFAGLFLTASLPLRSAAVTAGVFLGAALAILNYRWLSRFAVSVTSSGRGPSKGALFFYSMKYLLTGVAIFVAIKYDFADAVALLAGVSVIFLAICWEGIRLHRT
jgi:hypothetical protein